VLIALYGLALAAHAQPFPPQDESLRYSVNWPSGLSLGEAMLSAHHAASGWELDLDLDADVPGFAIADHFHSATNPDLCSQAFERVTHHGSKKTQEKTAFDYPAAMGHRTTMNGGTTDFLIAPHCAWDALAFLYSARRALAHGSIPPPVQIYFGSSYSLHMEYTGEQSIQVSDKPATADRVAVSLKGPASTSTFEMFFARDAARTPLLVKIPVAVGTISLELAR
jgi:hypothetical protein